MVLHIDQWSLVDSDLIVSAHPCEGYGESDGHYAIAYLFDIGGSAKRDVVVYPDEASRDAAFAALCAAIRTEEAQQQGERSALMDGDEGDMRP